MMKRLVLATCCVLLLTTGCLKNVPDAFDPPDGIEYFVHPYLDDILLDYRVSVEWSDTQDSYYVVISYVLSPIYSKTFSDHPEIWAFSLVDTGIRTEGTKRSYVNLLGKQKYDLFPAAKAIAWWDTHLTAGTAAKRFKDDPLYVDKDTFSCGLVSFRLGSLHMKRTKRIYLATEEGIRSD